jgi:hypothetical protein
MYQVGQVTYSIISDKDGGYIHEECIEGVLWLEDHWIYILHTENTVSREKSCKELACDDSCCDQIVIRYHWCSESHIRTDKVKAQKDADAFYERGKALRERLKEGKTKLIDARYHK